MDSLHGEGWKFKGTVDNWGIKINFFRYMPNFISLTITIGDRNFKVKIEEKDQAAVLKACDQINAKIMELKSNYGGKDMQDFLSMALLSFLSPDANLLKEKEEIDAALDQLNTLLDS